MKIAIYSPYLDTAGGGEKYMLTIGEILSEQNDVDVLLDSHLQSLSPDKIKQRIVKLHGLNLANVNFISAPIGKSNSFWQKIFFLKKYDWLFYLSDGSFFYSTAHHNIVHFQMPLKKISVSTPWQKIKLSSWQEAIYNSHFTQRFIEQKLSIRGRVIYPPVSVDFYQPREKKKQILTVGRFVGFNKFKKQDLMIEVFKQLVEEEKIEGWSFHLAGGVGEGDRTFLESLKNLAKGFPVFFYPNATLDQLAKLYGESTVYWHAAGFAEADPQKYEHFGITTVEAMAAGCIPVVVNLGGQTEIVEEGISGFLWDNDNQWKAKTMQVIKDIRLCHYLSSQATKRASSFSKSKFKESILSLINEY